MTSAYGSLAWSVDMGVLLVYDLGLWIPHLVYGYGGAAARYR